MEVANQSFTAGWSNMLLCPFFRLIIGMQKHILLDNPWWVLPHPMPAGMCGVRLTTASVF